MPVCITARCRSRFRALAFVLMLAAVFADTSRAQLTEFVIRSWDRRDGLPPVVINDIQRTTNGYLWLATQSGLLRFDGARFKRFDNQNNPEMRTNNVRCLLAEPSGGLWVGTSLGLYYLPDGRAGTGNAIEIGDHLSLRSMAMQPGGTVWGVSSSNIVVRIVEKEPKTRFTLPGAQIRWLVPDLRGGVAVATRNNVYAPQATQLAGWRKQVSESLHFDVITSSRSGGFWIASSKEIFRVDEAGALLESGLDNRSADAPQAPVMALMEDRFGRLWVGTRNGAIHCFDRQRGWLHVTPRRSRSLGSISSLYEDNEGLIWAGTAAGILHRIKPRTITSLSLPSTAQESVTQTVCVTRDGAVWVGTDGAGAYRSRNGIFQKFGAAEGLASATVMSILEDRQGTIWFGTLGGLFRFQDGEIQPELTSLVGGRPVPVVFQDSKDVLWFGTTGAVVRKSGEDVSIFELEMPDIDDPEVQAIAEGPKGELWFGTRGGGLFQWKDGRPEKVETFARKYAGLIHCDSEGVLWIGTRAWGLFRVKKRDVRNWRVGDGLPSNMLFAIMEDDMGTLWFSSDEGVFGLPKQALMDYVRNKSAPLVPIPVLGSDIENWSAGSGQPAAAKGPDGRLWFPVGHGVVAFNPATLIRERPELPVIIEEVHIDGAMQPFSGQEPIKIRSGVRRLEFRFTIADLDVPARLRFRYKLEGLDNEWVDGGSQRSAYYGPLPPGHYRLRVMSSGSASVWKEMAKPLSVTIVPRFWETGWFRFASAALIFSIVGGTAHFIGRAKMRRRLERLEMQQTMEKERRRIAQDLHDDLGSGITEIMLLSELAKQDNHELAPVHSQFGGITEKARQLATAMDEIVWTVNPRNDSLPNLASYISDYAQEFFRPAPAHCRIDIPESFPPVPVTAQQRHNLFMAVKEALNNAAKHSHAKQVWLRIQWTGDRLVVTVEDDGIGFDPAAGADEVCGNGLQNMRSRLEAIRGTTEFSSVPGKGTKVCFSMPLKS